MPIWNPWSQVAFGLGDMPFGFAVGGDVGHSSGGGIGSNGNDVGAVVGRVRGIGNVDDGGVDNISRAIWLKL